MTFKNKKRETVKVERDVIERIENGIARRTLN